VVPKPGWYDVSLRCSVRKQLVLTASGRDRPGILEEVTRLIVQHDGNVESGRFQRLGGDFAMMMFVTAPEDQIDALRGTLSELHVVKFDVQTRLSEVSDGEDEIGATVSIAVVGADHMGIIYQVTRYLADQGVNVESMATEVVAAPMSGAPLFTMSAAVRVPNKLSVEDLREALEYIGNELGVDTDVKTEVDSDRAGWLPAP
jgi:glycine cleavage system transcriptional repressor